MKRQQEVLEILAYTERMQNDTLGWIERSRELVGVCRQIGPEAETDNLDPKRYVRARLVYQSTDQIRGMKQMDLDNPPMSYDLSFTGLEKAPNGLYDYDEFMQHLQKSIDAYNASARGQHPWER